MQISKGFGHLGGSLRCSVSFIHSFEQANKQLHEKYNVRDMSYKHTQMYTCNYLYMLLLYAVYPSP